MSARDRKRRERALKSSGLAVYKVTVPQYETLSGLLATNKLTDDESRDPRKVEAALSKLIVAFAKEWADYFRHA